MRILLAIIGLLAVLGTAATAQDDLVFDIYDTQICLRGASNVAEKRACIGKSANACMTATTAGSSTYGMGGCLNFEAEWWDGQLNVAYKKLMKSNKADDKSNAEISDNLPKMAPALRDMQRAWIAFRDATCAYEYSQWGGGTGGGPASIDCVMRMTGVQTIYLQNSQFGY